MKKKKNLNRSNQSDPPTPPTPPLYLGNIHFYAEHQYQLLNNWNVINLAIIQLFVLASRNKRFSSGPKENSSVCRLVRSSSVCLSQCEASLSPDLKCDHCWGNLTFSRRPRRPPTGSTWGFFWSWQPFQTDSNPIPDWQQGGFISAGCLLPRSRPNHTAIMPFFFTTWNLDLYLNWATLASPNPSKYIYIYILKKNVCGIFL